MERSSTRGILDCTMAVLHKSFLFGSFLRRNKRKTTCFFISPFNWAEMPPFVYQWLWYFFPLTVSCSQWNNISVFRALYYLMYECRSTSHTVLFFHFYDSPGFKKRKVTSVELSFFLTCFTVMHNVSSLGTVQRLLICSWESWGNCSWVLQTGFFTESIAFAVKTGPWFCYLWQ